VTRPPVVRFEEAPFDAALFTRPLPDAAPSFCPLCGRALEYRYWDTVEGEYRYHTFACLNGAGPIRRLLSRLLTTSEPWGAHYLYRFGPTDNSALARFDARTGRPLLRDQQ
jgi:hypothetical protein